MSKTEMTLRKYKNEIVRKMRSMGTYREEFDSTIARTASLYVQLDKIERQYESSGGNAVIRHTNKAGATNAIKNPYLTARDEVFSQLLAHERELGLTPAAIKRLNAGALAEERGGPMDALAKALEELGGG